MFALIYFSEVGANITVLFDFVDDGRNLYFI